MKHTFIECSNQGKVRKQNEDSVGHSANESINAELFCVADGMGGYGKGDLASQSVVQSVINEFNLMTPQTIDPVDHLPELLISQAQTNLGILKAEQSINSTMGTTVALLLIIENQVVFANVGDSRIYSFDGSELTQKSYDHSFVNEMISQNVLTEEQAQNHPKKHVLTQAITGKDKALSPHVVCEQLNWNHIYLLCSDGLYNMVSTTFICDTLRRHSIFDAERILLDETLKNGARDNVSFILIRPFDYDDETTL